MRVYLQRVEHSHLVKIRLRVHRGENQPNRAPRRAVQLPTTVVVIAVAVGDGHGSGTAKSCCCSDVYTITRVGRCRRWRAMRICVVAEREITISTYFVRVAAATVPVNVSPAVIGLTIGDSATTTTILIIPVPVRSPIDAPANSAVLLCHRPGAAMRRRRPTTTATAVVAVGTKLAVRRAALAAVVALPVVRVAARIVAAARAAAWRRRRTGTGGAVSIQRVTRVITHVVAVEAVVVAVTVRVAGAGGVAMALAAVVVNLIAV